MITTSDQVYANLSLSLKQWLTAQSALDGLNILFLSEFEPSRYHANPVLLIQQATPRTDQMGVDGGFLTDDVDDAARTVDTLYMERVRADFTLDLGTDTVEARYDWSAKIKRVFQDAWVSGIPVYDLNADPAATVALGRMLYSAQDDLAHHYLPEIPEDRTWRNVIRFTPDYLHRFVQTASQPQLTGVELTAKETAI